MQAQQVHMPKAQSNSGQASMQFNTQQHQLPDNNDRLRCLLQMQNNQQLQQQTPREQQLMGQAQTEQQPQSASHNNGQQVSAQAQPKGQQQVFVAGAMKKQGGQ